MCWQSKPPTASGDQGVEADFSQNLPSENAFTRGYTQEQLAEISDIQAKIQGQLKNRRNFRVDEENNATLNLDHFKRTLTRYGLDLTEDESHKIFSFYDRDGGGELEVEEGLSARKRASRCSRADG